MGLISLSLDTPPSPGAIGPYLNGIFPASAPSEGSSWELEDPLPGMTFQSPTRLIAFPGSDDILLLSKLGELWRVSLKDQTRKLLLDIKDRSFKGGEAGVVGMILHPEFGNPAAPDKQLLFIFYRSKPDPDKWDEKGYNRLSKFKWNATSGTFDAASEEVLIQQYDRSTWHNGGAMFFGPDGFLYLSLGDEGNKEFRSTSTQSLSGGLFSGIIRIDVDNDPERSHPIRRQPRPNESRPAGWDAWGSTFTQGYSIPNDNPWLDPDGSILEEYYALGVRSPFAMHFDPETQLIWVADVGGGLREEVSLVEKGDNLQWPFIEGRIESEDYPRPATIIGREKAAYFDYDRSIGACIIGGGPYRNTLYPELNGNYLFADYTHRKVMLLTNNGSQAEPERRTLLKMDGQPFDFPEESGITCVFVHHNGEILITTKGKDWADTGKIYRLKKKSPVPEPPARLSELGVFTDLEKLTPIDGLIPYRVNAPLWSDRAVKTRWMALPNDGFFDSSSEKIHFQANKEWTFPAGTVFIKHFELPLTDNPAGATVKLETRFFVVGENNNAYGLTYKWNDEGTDAFLLGGGAFKDFEVSVNGQSGQTQTWDFPSRDQCMSCHNASAGFVLGVKTHQLNGEINYPHLGRSRNQLEYLNEIGVFHRDIGRADELVRAYPVEDISADLDLRIRSYLDANCANCHRPGGVPTTSLDLRFNVPLALQNIINVPTNSQTSDPNRMIVKPGFHESSELWVRDAGLGANRMPPVGRNLVDENYIAALTEWIGQLSDEDGQISELLLFPNPSKGQLSIRIPDEWPAPFRITVQNASGLIVRKETYDSRIIYLDLREQVAGMYFLEIIAGEERWLKKVVIQ